MINIKNILNTEDKKRLLSNFLSLSVLQGANYILPLITLPYLVRTLGAEKFGLIMFAQAFVQYFITLTDYGFNLSATREISIHRENKEKVSEIFSSVMIIKFILLFISLIFLTLIVFLIDKLKEDWIIFYLTFGIVIGQVLFPVWLFQGMEKMKYITLVEVSIKVFFLILIFVFIHTSDDFWKAPLINSLGMILGGIFSIFIAIKQFSIKFYIPSLKIIFNYLRSSTSLFLSQVSVTLFNQTNTFIGGLIFNYSLIGFYNAAEKIFVALRNIFGIIFRTFHPFFSRRNKDMSHSYNIFALVVSLLPSLLLFLTADIIVRLLYGSGFEITVDALKILSIALFFSGINIMIFTLWFLSNGFYKVFFWITTFAGFSNVVLLLFLSETVGILGIPTSVAITEFILICLYIYHKRKLRVRNVL